MVNTKIKLITFFVAKDGEAVYSQQKQEWEMTLAQIINSLLQNLYRRQGAECGSDHELLIAKFRLKLKKVGEITRLFRYD